jgi:hypothetical protein
VRRLLSHLIPVHGDLSQELLELGQQGICLFDGEEPGEGTLHVLLLLLAAVRQPVGEHIRETGGPDPGLGLLHVVLDEAVDDPGSFRRILGDDVGCEGIAVPGLTDGARVDEIGSVRRQVEDVVGAGGGLIGRGGDGLYVCVTEKADSYVRVLRFQDGEVLSR